MAAKASMRSCITPISWLSYSLWVRGCRALFQLIDPFLQVVDALVVLPQSLQQGHHQNTHEGQAAAADQLQQHAPSPLGPMLT